MGWVYRQTAAHSCEKPRTGWGLRLPDGQEGDLWRCDHCGALWSIYGFSWSRAGWWREWKARVIEKKSGGDSDE